MTGLIEMRRSHIYVVAADAASGKKRIDRLLDDQRNVGSEVVLVTEHSDMRGRKVASGDVVVIAGDWSRVANDKVKWLVDMFNTRRDLTAVIGEVPALKYKPGESPIVYYPTSDAPLPMGPLPVGPTGPNGPPGPEPVVVQTQTLGGPGQSYITWSADTSIPQTLAADPTEALVKELHQARDLLAANKELVDSMVKQVTQLREWLSGVQPVEDPEIPGIFWCGVCGARLPAHADDCPAAPIGS